VSDRGLLDEQVAYYRARAAEYDATSAPPGDPFASHAEAIRDALRRLAPAGRVLEIAAGTGSWTGVLADIGSDVLVTDASAEMLELARAKVGERSNVRYEVRDAFDLPATHEFDLVAFGFFLSHVPASEFDRFWAGVAETLAPGGRVALVDEGRHLLWREDWLDERAGIVRRTLTDGTVHRAVKVLWDPAELEARLRDLGWDASVRSEGPFYFAVVSRASAKPLDGSGPVE
jgi:demethylmenaquinone methyltransferase/2-methoxy-6-polyprenyl-1,4-benzoquinol methylase